MTMTTDELKNKFGGYNDYPPNWSPATDHEFWPRFCNRLFVHVEDRQMKYPQEVHEKMPYKHMCHAKLFFLHDDTGIAFVYQVKEARYTTPLLYKFGICFHKNKEGKNVGTCLNEYTCLDCGYVEVIDSSG